MVEGRHWIRAYLGGQGCGEEAEEPVGGDDGHVAAQILQVLSQARQLGVHQLLINAQAQGQPFGM